MKRTSGGWRDCWQVRKKTSPGAKVEWRTGSEQNSTKAYRLDKGKALFEEQSRLPVEGHSTKAWKRDNCFETAAMCHYDEVRAVAISCRVVKQSLSDGAQRAMETICTVLPLVGS